MTERVSLDPCNPQEYRLKEAACCKVSLISVGDDLAILRYADGFDLAEGLDMLCWLIMKEKSNVDSTGQSFISFLRRS